MDSRTENEWSLIKPILGLGLIFSLLFVGICLINKSYSALYINLVLLILTIWITVYTFRRRYKSYYSLSFYGHVSRWLYIISIFPMMQLAINGDEKFIWFGVSVFILIITTIFSILKHKGYFAFLPPPKKTSKALNYLWLIPLGGSPFVYRLLMKFFKDEQLLLRIVLLFMAFIFSWLVSGFYIEYQMIKKRELLKSQTVMASVNIKGLRKGKKR